jgi:hypothetical protein
MIVRFKLFGEAARAIDQNEYPGKKVPFTVEYDTKIILTIKSVEGHAVVEGEFEI